MNDDDLRPPKIEGDHITRERADQLNRRFIWAWQRKLEELKQKFLRAAPDLDEATRADISDVFDDLSQKIGRMAAVAPWAEGGSQEAFDAYLAEMQAELDELTSDREPRDPE